MNELEQLRLQASVHNWTCKYFNIPPDTPSKDVITLLKKQLWIAFKYEGPPQPHKMLGVE